MTINIKYATTVYLQMLSSPTKNIKKIEHCMTLNNVLLHSLFNISYATFSGVRRLKNDIGMVIPSCQ